MASRIELQTFLESLLGSKEVYFQKPESKKMKYPAIKYSLSGFDNKHANNGVYGSMTRYDIILMDWDPDSEFVEKLKNMQYCSFDRHYPADGLNHWSFTLYW